MNALEWLKKQQADSLRRQALFDARPRVAASQAWSGYADKPGGQRLMVRQPEVDNTLTVKNDGTRTLVKKWKDPDQSNIKISAVPRDRSPIRQSMIPPPRNQRNPFDIPEHMFPQGLSPEAQAAIAQVQATGGQNVDAYGEPVGIGENINPARRSPQTIRGVASGYARHPRPITPEVVRASESAPRETWGGDLKLTMPQDPITRGWIQDPATILNIGNLIKKMGGTIDYMKGIDDRIKENRDRRFRMFNSDPYSPVRKY